MGWPSARTAGTGQTGYSSWNRPIWKGTKVIVVRWWYVLPCFDYYNYLLKVATSEGYGLKVFRLRDTKTQKSFHPKLSHCHPRIDGRVTVVHCVPLVFWPHQAVTRRPRFHCVSLAFLRRPWAHDTFFNYFALLKSFRVPRKLIFGHFWWCTDKKYFFLLSQVRLWEHLLPVLNPWWFSGLILAEIPENTKLEKYSKQFWAIF